MESLIEMAMRVLPHAYRAVPAPEGTSVTLRLAEDPPRGWTLRREGDQWRLYRGAVARPTVCVTAADAMWRLFYNALPESEVPQALALAGPRELIVPLLGARSVMV